MQPLTLMNNVQKARLLHGLMANEIPAFLEYVKEANSSLKENARSLRENWKNQLFGFDFWLQLAGDADKVIGKYGKELHKSSTLFADQLFDGYLAIYVVNALIQYVDAGKYTDPKMEHAVALLFT